MGGTVRQFNKMYMDYKKQFKKTIYAIAALMPLEFSDDEFNEYLIKHGKKSRYNFRKPYNFILDCSYHVRNNLRKNQNRTILTAEEKARTEAEILSASLDKVKNQRNKLFRRLYYVQEIEPKYVKAFIDHYFSTHRHT